MNKVPNPSESQDSYLPTGFMFPYGDTSGKITLQSVAHLIAEFGKREKTNKLCKLRTDISGHSLFPMCLPTEELHSGLVYTTYILGQAALLQRESLNFGEKFN